MKKTVCVALLAMTMCLWACGNKTTGDEASCPDPRCADTSCSDCPADSLGRDGARGDGDAFESDADTEIAGPGENKPCHASGCKCKFGYAGNRDAKYYNKCGHEMSKHY